MSAPDNGGGQPVENADWQGKLTADAEASQKAEQVVITGRPKLHSDARHLLGELVRPHRRAIVFVVLIVLVQVGATMAGPWLIGVAIDQSLPAARAHHYNSLIGVAVALVGCALLSGWLRAVFVLRSGRIGQAILFDLRRRAFDHTQALSVSFHERFTSGRGHLATDV